MEELNDSHIPVNSRASDPDKVTRGPVPHHYASAMRGQGPYDPETSPIRTGMGTCRICGHTHYTIVEACVHCGSRCIHWVDTARFGEKRQSIHSAPGKHRRGFIPRD